LSGAALDNSDYLERLHDLYNRRFAIEQWRLALDDAVSAHNATCHLSCIERPTEQHRSLCIEVNVFRYIEAEFWGDFNALEAALTILELSLSPWSLTEDA
jgi:hypothetical protein